MVFRGKPSKGCQRCRARRAKCEVRAGPCGQCVRANEFCSGYRDASELRIENESRSVARKALKNGPRIEITIMPSNTNREAREIFFAYYITSRCWEFLSPYHHYPGDAPKHLDQAIEACSSAYLWHIVPTDSTLSLAREKYVSALRLTNKAIRSPGNARKDTTLMTSLLLDLFEKITNSQPRSDVLWRSHVDGALALAKARGLERFMATSDLSMLMRVGTHCIMRKQEGFRKEDHTHNPNHQSSCYTLIFPLYVAARYRRELRPWVIDQLHYIGDHFRTRNAEVVAQTLENGADVHTWKVFAMLGSYAVTSS